MSVQSGESLELSAHLESRYRQRRDDDWNEEERSKCSRCQNVGDVERLVSALAGAGLVASALARPSLPRMALGLMGGGLLYRAATGQCGLYQSLGINTAESNRRGGVRAKRGFKHESSVVISRPPGELYDYWRRLSNLPKLIEHLESVVESGDGRSQWTAVGPLGKRIEWQAEIHNEVPGEMLAWRSLPDSELDTAGSIHFQPIVNDRGTAVTLSVKYDPPAGKIGAIVADLLGRGVEDELAAALRKFKQLMEAGEVPSVEGQPQGDCRC